KGSILLDLGEGLQLLELAVPASSVLGQRILVEGVCQRGDGVLVEVRARGDQGPDVLVELLRRRGPPRNGARCGACSVATQVRQQLSLGGETLLLLRQLSVELRERFVLALPVHLEDSADPPQWHPASRQLPDAQQSDQVADAVAAVAVRVTRDLREQADPVIVPQGA